MGAIVSLDGFIAEMRAHDHQQALRYALSASESLLARAASAGVARERKPHAHEQTIVHMADQHAASVAGAQFRSTAASPWLKTLAGYSVWLQAKPGSEAAFEPATFTRAAAQIYFTE